VGRRKAIRVAGFVVLALCGSWAQQVSSVLPGNSGAEFSFRSSTFVPGSQQVSSAALPDAPLPQPPTPAIKFQAFVDEATSPLLFGAATLNALSLREAGEHAPPGAQYSFGSLYGFAVAQRESSVFLGRYFYPWLLKQDPRYYPSHSDNILGRTVYAASRLLITRNDAGKSTLNTSYLLGVLTSAAVATAYKPYWAHSSSAIFSDFGSTIGSDAGMNVFHEFWPAIRNKLQQHSPNFVKRLEKSTSRITGSSQDNR
jgi:hypothetical protein